MPQDLDFPALFARAAWGPNVHEPVTSRGLTPDSDGPILIRMGLFPHRGLDPNNAEHRALRRIEYKLDLLLSKEKDMTDQISQIEQDETDEAADIVALSTDQATAFSNLEAALDAALANAGLTPEQAAAIDQPIKDARAAIQGLDAAAQAAAAAAAPPAAPSA